MRDFKRLTAWQKAHALALTMYRTTASFPRDELYGLTSQIRRAGVSIPANIAEGCGKTGEADFGRFLQIALGSACELEYHILLAHDLDFVADADYGQLDTQVNEVKRMLISLLQKLKTPSP